MRRDWHFYEKTPPRRRALRVAGLCALGAAVSGGTGGFIISEEMGAAPSGERLRRIEASPNWRDGAFRNLVEVPA